MTASELANSLQWTGDTAAPTPEFWRQWPILKDALREIGVTLGKVGESWIVRRKSFGSRSPKQSKSLDPEEQLRERLNPNWRTQLSDHYTQLGISGPVRLSAKDIVVQSLRRQGLEPRRRRRR